MSEEEEVIRLKLNNEKLIKGNKKLTEMMKIMDKFRVMLISMVNNCKCNTELNFRMKFNLLMEEYYDIKDNNCIEFNANHKIKPKVNQNSNEKVVDLINNKLINDSIIQNSDNFVVNNLENVQTFTQNTDNINSREYVSNNEKTINDSFDSNQVIDKRVHITNDESKVAELIPKPRDEKELDLRERIARLRRYVARPKIYSRMNRTKRISDQRFACSWPGCDSVFKAKVDMKTHMWRHTGEKIYACEWPGCEKRFPVKRNLARHRETHEGVKHYACDWPGCEYKSWYPQGVRAHRKRHTDERPHKCSWPHCEWTFRQSHHLKAHMLKHTGEKPFACVWTGCDNRFQSRQAMKFHCDRAHHKT